MTAAAATKPLSFFHAVDWSVVSSEHQGRDIGVENMCNVGALLVDFFDLWGFAFKPVRNDVSGNLRKIRNSFDTEPVARRTVGELLQREVDTNTAQKDPSGTVGLLWFKRGLEYLCTLLTLLYESRSRQEDFGTSELCSRAYDATLKSRHGWLMRKTFSVVSAAAPYRSKLMEKLAYGNTDLPHSQLYEVMPSFLAGMRSFVDNVNSVLVGFGVETPVNTGAAATAEEAAGADCSDADDGASKN